MIRRLAVMMGLIGVVAVSLSGCVTAADKEYGTAQPAILVDADHSPTRNLIQTYVRDFLGSGYTLNIDQLSRGSQLVARDNGRSQVTGPHIPLPDRIFVLEIVRGKDGPVCRLRPDTDQPDAAPLLLPKGTDCRIRP